MKTGDIVFAYDFKISKSGRFYKILEPTELRVVKQISSMVVELDDHRCYSCKRVFSTYQEAKDSWNSELNNALEKLRCDYENKIRNIKRRLL